MWCSSYCHCKFQHCVRQLSILISGSSLLDLSPSFSLSIFISVWLCANTHDAVFILTYFSPSSILISVYSEIFLASLFTIKNAFTIWIIEKFFRQYHHFSHFNCVFMYTIFEEANSLPPRQFYIFFSIWYNFYVKWHECQIVLRFCAAKKIYTKTRHG